MLEKLERHFRQHSEMMYRDLCPWEIMSSTQASRVRGLNTNFSRIVPRICMVSGERDHVVCAHILPFSTKHHVQKSLGMLDNLNDFRNLLWLCKGIEHCFDKMLLSFVPDKSNPLLANRYRIHLWTETILDIRLDNSPFPPTISTRCIKDIKDNIIDFSAIGHNPFRRCLSYQAFMCYWKWKTYADDDVNIIEPEDFDLSDYDGDFKAKRSEYLETYLKDLRDELEEEEEEVGEY